MAMRSSQDSSNEDSRPNKEMAMFTFENSGIQIPLPNIDVIENEEGWGEVKVIDGSKIEMESHKNKEHLQHIKTIENLKNLEVAFQKSSEELAIEKNKHADTLAQNNKYRETILELTKRLENLEKANADLTKQNNEATEELEENSKLVQKRDDYLTEIRKRLGDAETNKEKLLQTIREMTRTNEILKKNLEESKNQLSKITTEYENAKKLWVREQNKLQHELKVQFNELESKIDQLEKARVKISKLENPKTRSSARLYENKKKNDYTNYEKQTKSIIKYG
jgi:chromosome segregation ATPase